MSLVPQRKAIAVFAVLALAYFLSALIRAITATLAPTLVHELSLNAADLGLLAGAYFLGFTLTQLPLWTQAPAPNMTAAASQSTGYAEIWRNPYFRMLMPLGFFGYGGMIAIQTLWVVPWMVRVAGSSPVQATTGLFWISIAMLLIYWLWGLANPWFTRHKIGANQLLLQGVPLSIAPLLLLVAIGAAWPAAAPWAWDVFCVLAKVCTIEQPAVGVAFPAELAGRALTAYNLVVFCGVFTVQWGIGQAIEALRARAWSETAAYQGALAGYALCYVLSYLYFLLAKKP